MDYYRNIDHFRHQQPSFEPVGLSYERIEDMEEEPVSLDFFKAHARIDFDMDDALVPSYLKAARQELELWTQRSFGPQTWRLTALHLPENWQLMYGPVTEILTEGYSVFADYLQEGGENVSIEYRTRGLIDENIRVAICRYAAGLYAIREHVVINDKGNPILSSQYVNEAKEMLRRIKVRVV